MRLRRSRCSSAAAVVWISTVSSTGSAPAPSWSRRPTSCTSRTAIRATSRSSCSGSTRHPGARRAGSSRSATRPPATRPERRLHGIVPPSSGAHVSGWRVGIDTGGTYTDLVAIRGSDRRIAKVPSTPPDYDQGVIDAIAAAGIEPGAIDLLAHGTTVATNAIITGSGAPTALLTTAGFRDILQLGRHNRGEPFDILWDPPAPLVPRRHRYEVRERLDWAGGVVEPLDERSVRDAARAAAAEGIEAFAICFLHSYMNPEHEERAHAIVSEELPDAFVVHSAELLREPPEFERTSTVVINATLMPVVTAYLSALERRLGE